MKNVLYSILGIFVVGGVIVGGYLGGWWLKEDSVNRDSQINNDSYARQTALTDQIIDLHSQITTLDVTLAGEVTDAQRIAIGTNRAGLVNNLCDAYAKTTGTVTLSNSIHTFIAQEC